MYPGKLLSLDHFFSVLCSKGRVISGLGAGILALLLVFSLLFSVGGNGDASAPVSSPSSLLSWFYSAPGNVSEKSVVEPHEPKPEKVSVSGGEEAAGQGGPSQVVRAENLIANGTVDGILGNSAGGNSTGDDNHTVPVKTRGLEKPNGGALPANRSDGSYNVGEELPPGETHMPNLNVQDNFSRSPMVNSREGKTNSTNFLNGRGNDTLGDGEAHGVAADGFPTKCDIFSGRWIRDESKPYYSPRSCPYVDSSFNCHGNGRPDYEFLKWRWQPRDCDIPSLNATDFLRRLRGQRLIFVGDSLNRNMWESLVCILRHSVRKKNRVYEASGRKKFKTEGYYSIIFKDYNCSVDFVRSPFLVREYVTIVNGSEDEKLRLDVMDGTTSTYRDADIVVFNTGHWWTHEKTSRGVNYYQEGERVYPLFKAMEAYRRALVTWAKWLDRNINPNKTQVFFRGYSLTHFRGGQWNSGGQCHREREPIYNESYVGKYPGKMKVFERVLRRMKTPVVYLNISRLTGYRKDAHPSIYRTKYKSVEEQIDAEKTQDCSHWCLPGVPDAWNELLYASLLQVGRGSWKK